MSEIIVDRDVACELRDGTTLYANVYRPARGQYPVLLSRLPYNKNLPAFSHRYVDPFRLVEAGFVVVIQDVRGRFASEGTFEPLAQELADGYDAVMWASRLSYGDGQVGMFGLSYYAFTQLFALMERPPALKAIFPAMTGSLEADSFWRNGVFELVAAETWLLDSVAPDVLARRLEREEYAEAEKVLTKDLEEIEAWHHVRPVCDWPPVMKHEALQPLFQNFLAQRFREPIANHPEHMNGTYDFNIPAYHLAGWYDNFLGPTLRNYERLQASNPHQKLMIGPWGHGQFQPEQGERFFGLHAGGDAIDGQGDLTDQHIHWFRCFLYNESPGEEPPVKLFVMGDNVWREENEWPLARTVYTPLYLHSSGQAGFSSEDGVLSWEAPGVEPADGYVYDPDNPVPTLGGGTLFFAGRNAGPRDQRPLQTRPDVLTYKTIPLSTPLEITGWVTMQLWAKTSGVDTDFTAKFIDVGPDGTAYNLTDGIVRVSTAMPDADDVSRELLELEIDLWATSYVFQAGHALQIEVSSSSFPRFEPNLNTGSTMLESSTAAPVEQTIYHDTHRPTHLILPVIPRP
ncbi:hypothetical protein B0H94_11451 [Salsuginibacillus halophilus]|uniref:Xaa-Pro dipeptidyl-peptidase C-terminal domain-containing protein n=1 Tax=Salsuginibacillus halophilus TaxID=517424 RepID=A0A2P8H8M2_9BACI|nr:CocE/NonD family hydrolase [Salsuginibacillus halophilus]PSL42577.1 hypothetical protein B0H94_11451 [Salsuginibacillus halophilus]